MPVLGLGNRCDECRGGNATTSDGIVDGQPAQPHQFDLQPDGKRTQQVLVSSSKESR